MLLLNMSLHEFLLSKELFTLESLIGTACHIISLHDEFLQFCYLSSS